MAKPTIPDIDVDELTEPDSDFAMLEHFGEVLLPTPKAPELEKKLPYPAHVPDFALASTEWSRIGDRVRGGKL